MFSGIRNQKSLPKFLLSFGHVEKIHKGIITLYSWQNGIVDERTLWSYI